MPSLCVRSVASSGRRSRLAASDRSSNSGAGDTEERHQIKAAVALRADRRLGALFFPQGLRVLRRRSRAICERSLHTAFGTPVRLAVKRSAQRDISLSPFGAVDRHPIHGNLTVPEHLTIVVMVVR